MNYGNRVEAKTGIKHIGELFGLCFGGSTTEAIYILGRLEKMFQLSNVSLNKLLRIGTCWLK